MTIILTSILASLFIEAQTETSPEIQNQASRWTFGGSAGLGGAFGNGGGVSVHLSPRIGYKLLENLEGGLSSGLTWSNSKDYSSTTIGVGPFANYYFPRNFYLSAMFQQYFNNQKNKINDLTFSGDESALYLGGGYMQKVGDQTYMQIGGMYNVLYNKTKSFLGGGFIPNIGVVFVL